MATLKDFRDERIRKLNELEALGINPYPATVKRDKQIFKIHKQFSHLEGQTLSVAGRIGNIRKFGKIAFMTVTDITGTLQLFLREEHVKPLNQQAGTIGMAQLSLLDTGDFISATGEVIKTKTGEISLDVSELQMITKALRPLPDAHDGFKNKEERLRRRYLDIATNKDVRERFLRRSVFWQATREYLILNGFVEINIPVLEAVAGGADANPFVTHMDALDQDFYLRISHELPLKRLIGAGYERVFDIGPRFRNEGLDDEHLPEHVAMEWYAAYWNWEDGMSFTQELVRYIVDHVWGKRQFTLPNGVEIDLGVDGQDFPRISFVSSIYNQFGIDVFNTRLEEVITVMAKHGIIATKTDNLSRCIDKLWKAIRKDINGPAFLVDIPVFLQPLAKKSAKDPRLTEQFNLLLAGTEACKAYSELNDPIDQYNRFVEQQKMRDEGDSEAMMMDIDFIEMLEYGMPATCGYGHSERLFWLLEGVTAREGVPFPQMRHEISEVTKSIYNL